jgi:hypothetical protein
MCTHHNTEHTEFKIDRLKETPGKFKTVCDNRSILINALADVGHAAGGLRYVAHEQAAETLDKLLACKTKNYCTKADIRTALVGGLGSPHKAALGYVFGAWTHLSKAYPKWCFDDHKTPLLGGLKSKDDIVMECSAEVWVNITAKRATDCFEDDDVRTALCKALENNNETMRACIAEAWANITKTKAVATECFEDIVVCEALLAALKLEDENVLSWVAKVWCNITKIKADACYDTDRVREALLDAHESKDEDVHSWIAKAWLNITQAEPSNTLEAAAARRVKVRAATPASSSSPPCLVLLRVKSSSESSFYSIVLHSCLLVFSFSLSPFFYAEGSPRWKSRGDLRSR